MPRVSATITDRFARLEFPLEVVSEPNRRDHWAVRHRRSSNQQNVVAVELAALRQLIQRIGLPAVVTLTLLTPRKLDDDNLLAALKAVRDSVSKSIGLPNDADPRVTWRYDQEPIAFNRKARTRVRIEIVQRPG